MADFNKKSTLAALIVGVLLSGTTTADAEESYNDIPEYALSGIAEDTSKDDKEDSFDDNDSIVYSSYSPQLKAAEYFLTSDYYNYVPDLVIEQTPTPDIGIGSTIEKIVGKYKGLEHMTKSLNDMPIVEKDIYVQDNNTQHKYTGSSKTLLSNVYLFDRGEIKSETQSIVVNGKILEGKVIIDDKDYKVTDAKYNEYDKTTRFRVTDNTIKLY